MGRGGKGLVRATVSAALLGLTVAFLGLMLFLNDFLSGRLTDGLVLGLVCIGGGIFWIRAERIDIIGFEGSFHGRTLAAVNASGETPNSRLSSGTKG